MSTAVFKTTDAPTIIFDLVGEVHLSPLPVKADVSGGRFNMNKKEFERLCKYLKDPTVVPVVKAAHLMEKLDELIEYVRKLEEQEEQNENKS